jgi:hypothetical protein
VVVTDASRRGSTISCDQQPASLRGRWRGRGRRATARMPQGPCLRQPPSRRHPRMLRSLALRRQHPTIRLSNLLNKMTKTLTLAACACRNSNSNPPKHHLHHPSPSQGASLHRRLSQTTCLPHLHRRRRPMQVHLVRQRPPLRHTATPPSLRPLFATPTPPSPLHPYAMSNHPLRLRTTNPSTRSAPPNDQRSARQKP